MTNEQNNHMNEVPLDDLTRVGGGVVVDSGDGQYWVVRQDGTVIAPAPNLEKALEFARTMNVSTEVLNREGYRRRFGRELVW